jgi:xanthine dehydrogenase YagR molybdenum-binding subunit
MIWGVSFALHEAAAIDRRSRRTLNANLAEYHVPVNADVPSLEALMINEHDPHVNALGIKGVGEIGIAGTAGAVPTQSGMRPDPGTSFSHQDRRSRDACFT